MVERSDSLEFSSLPAGRYERLIDEDVAHAIGQLTELHASNRALDPSESADVLTRFLAGRMHRTLRTGSPEEQLALTQALLATLQQHDASGSALVDPPQVLESVQPALLPGQEGMPAPLLPLAMSDLLVNAPNEPRFGEMLSRELRSADRVDVIVAFVRWAGIRVLWGALESLRDRGVPVRLITTTYLGATQRRAIDHLAQLGVEVKVSYDTRSTRLHAKAWVLHRNSGFSTAFLGSSNLSRQALIDGLEWNVRLASEHAPDLVNKMAQSFDAYWSDPEFEPYDPERDAARFDAAIGAQSTHPGVDMPILPGLEVTPWPYQTEILEALAAERIRHNRWRNLVISPTGTGKTVVAALDFRRLQQLDGSLGRTPTLLFVAHRQEILRQSLATFRAVLNEHSFGELFVDGQAPTQWKHVFASIQSLSTARMRGEDLSRFDVVIVDEFHHAEATTYQRLLERIEPRLLLGMTATPERSDGVDVRRWFDDRAAFEMRLWDALDQRLLSPFQYFGVGEEVDLSALSWRRGAYAADELSNVLTGDDARVRHVLRQVHDIVEDPHTMRALGFCVSVAHAQFMARRFNEAGIAAEAVLGETKSEDRAEAIRRLRSGELQVLFTVDLFNEGFDVPVIDTVLFLRPTESATVFLQQLGRGLRKAEGKACLTVLDFIGRQHQEFRFDLRFRAITGRSRRQVERDVEAGFPLLPSGCSIQLDRVAQEIVLRNVRQQLKNTSKMLEREAQRLAGEVENLDLVTFLEETGLSIEDFYETATSGWTGVQRAAGFALPAAVEAEAEMARNVGNLLHVDDPERLGLLREPGEIGAGIAAEGGYPYRLARQVLTTLAGEQRTVADPAAAVGQLNAALPILSELRQLGSILEDRARKLVTPVVAPAGVPISVHATYTRAEIAEAFGFRARGWVTGVRYVEEVNTDLLMVTLRKEETHFTPTTMYADAFVSRDVFHWESQSAASRQSTSGRRYLERSSTVLLFVRIHRKEPFVALGPVELIDARGDRPIAINWRLLHRPPEEFFQQARQVAA
jgi:superfamily II DNA or RNA helicase/HKD family nuclease